MRVSVLGPVEVQDGERLVPVSGSRVRRLLVRLAVDAPRAVSTAELAEAVWFDGEMPREPANALQSLVSRLRRALGEAALVEQAPAGYRLLDCRTDLADFESAARAGREQVADGCPEAGADTLRAALRLWRGDPLQDAADAPYARAVLARLAEEHTGVLCDRIDADLAGGAGAELVGELEELTATMPLRERLTGQLMTALAAAGRGAEALAVFATLRARLAEELGSEPGRSVQDIHLAILRGTPGPELSAGSPAAPRTSLTSFVGRADELKRVHELLSAGRLTTIVGPGGAGKTRLASEAARTWPAPRRWDGHWLVELAPITDAANLTQAFLTTLGVREARMVERPTDRPVSRDALTRLVDSLRDSRCLVVVDNCEHLIDDVARLLAHLLSRCPELRVLATTREPIGIDGESLCVVPPLAFPPEQAEPADALEFPSVQLLVDRASAVRADFEVTEANVGHVVEIVRRLDGLPLAIELAAARLRVLPVGEVAARLEDRFRLLTGGNRAAMPRHRTLRAVVQWSWDLLTPGERLLAERLAVFPAGAAVASAEAVCAVDRLPAADILGLLDSLVDKSLLQVSEEGGLRYRMLETIREYGVERLLERGEVDRARGAHAQFFAALVREAAPRLRGPDQLAAFQTIEREHDNVLAALRFLGDSGQADETVALALDLSWYWILRNEHSDASTWLAFACSVEGGQDQDLRVLAEASMVVNRLASMESFGTEDDAEATQQMATLGQRLRALPDLGERFEPGRVLLQVGASFVTADGGDLGGVLEDGLLSADPWIRAAVRMLRAAVAENNGDVHRMRADVEQALTEFRALGDRWGLATTLSSLGYLMTLDGDLAAARSAYTEAADLLQQVSANADGGFTRLRLAELCVRQGAFGEARSHVRSLLATPQGRSGSMATFAKAMLAAIAAFEGDHAAMRRLRAEVAAELDDIGLGHPVTGHGRAIAFAMVGWLYASDGDMVAARERLEQAYPMALGTHDQPIVAMVGVAVAGLAAELGQSEHAARVLGASARLRGADDRTERRLAALTARLQEELGDGFASCYAEGKALSVEAAQAALDPALLTEPAATR